MQDSSCRSRDQAAPRCGGSSLPCLGGDELEERGPLAARSRWPGPVLLRGRGRGSGRPLGRASRPPRRAAVGSSPAFASSGLRRTARCRRRWHLTSSVSPLPGDGAEARSSSRVMSATAAGAGSTPSRSPGSVGAAPGKGRPLVVVIWLWVGEVVCHVLVVVFQAG